jgi:hypothetical protein
MATSLNTSAVVRDAGEQQVHYIRKRYTFADATASAIITVGKIPAFASVVGGGVHVTTAFNATTTNVVNVGFIGATTDASGYASGLTTGAVGYIVLDDLGSTKNIQGTVEHTITAAPTETGAASSAGVADIIITYITGNSAG